MDNTNERIDQALLPTHRELKRRKNPWVQFWIFVRISWVMFWLARRKH
jgi:hypothetical protein